MLLLSTIFKAAQAAPQKSQDRFQVFTQYEYRFPVPEEKADQIWEQITRRYAGSGLRQGFTANITEQHIIDLYFDDEKHSFLEKNLALRQRLYISGDGRKATVQFLVSKGNNHSEVYIFKENRKPDKGAAFTTHPLLKLVRSKDRPALDSLLKSFKIPATALSPALEVMQQEKSLQLRRQGTDWVTLVLVQGATEVPERHFTELQVRVSQQLAKIPEKQLAQLRFTADTIAASLQKHTKLHPETGTEYASIIKARQHEQPGFTRTKALAGTVLLVGMVSYFIFRKLRRKKKKQ